MITLNFSLKGIESINKMLLKLPIEANNKVFDSCKEFMYNVQKSAKLRAPKATGFLSKSIKIEMKQNCIVLYSDAPYAFFQESGYTPHVIPVQYMEAHYSSPGSRINRIPRKEISEFVTVSQFTPFLMPALQANIPYLTPKLANAIDKAIKSS